MYEWYRKGETEPVSTDTFFNFTEAGEYYLKISDTIGCSGMDTIRIYENPEIYADPVPKVICKGDTTTLEAKNTGGNSEMYEWTDTLSNKKFSGRKVEISPDTTTTYELLIRETVGNVTCTDSDLVTIKVNPLPEITIETPFPERCANGDVVNLNKYSDPGPGEWIGGPGGSVNNINHFNPKISGPGKFMLTYIYQDPQTGCVNKDSALIEVKPLPNVDAGIDTFRCTHQGPYSLEGSPSVPAGRWTGDGVRGSEYNWRFDPEKVNEGSHELIYSYTDPDTKCENQDTMIMTSYQSPQPDAGEDKEMCINDKNLLLNGNPGDGIAEWSVIGRGAEIVNDNEFSPEKPGDFNVLYTSVTYGKCTVSDTVKISVHDTPIVKAAIKSGKDHFCIDHDIVKLQGTPTGPNTTKWEWRGPGMVNRDEFDPEKAGAGKHLLFYSFTDKNGCTNEEKLSLNVRALPVSFGSMRKQLEMGFVMQRKIRYKLKYIPSPKPNFGAIRRPDVLLS